MCDPQFETLIHYIISEGYKKGVASSSRETNVDVLGKKMKEKGGA